MAHRHAQPKTPKKLPVALSRLAHKVARRPYILVAVAAVAVLCLAGASIPVLAAQSASDNSSVPPQASQTASAQSVADQTSGTVTLQPTATAWTSARTPTRAYPLTPYLSASHAQDKTYLSFDLSSLKGLNVSGASLQLHVASSTSSAPGVQVFPSSSNWSPATTDATRPADQPTPLSNSAAKATPGTTVSLPLGSTAVSGSGTVSFRIGYSQPYVSTTFTRSGSAGPRLVLTISQPTSTAVPTPPPSSVPPTSSLAFSVAGSNTSSKKVFAHYFPPYPISLDNQPAASDYYTRNYLAASGEGGIHAAYGGLLRDRPLPRAPLAGNWQVADMTTEVDEASNEGIDGFTVDILSLSGNNWTNTLNLMSGAVASGRHFSVVPNLDLTSSAGNAGIPAIAAALAQLYKSPAAYRLDSGEYVLSTFAAERQSPSWWASLKSTMASTYGDNIALISVFLDASDANMQAYASVSYSEGNWGTRSPSTVESAPDYAAKAHALGTKWMAPIAVQDVRPRSYLYAEAGNTETLRDSWQRALSDGADLVQMVTWNDYSESTSFAPSVNHGDTFLDISAYYATQFKTGHAPAITGDSLYITHRIQLFGAQPTTSETLMQPTLSGTSTAPRDTVEVLTFLTSSAQVTVNVGGAKTTYTAPAGFSTHTVPLGLGVISATAERGNTTILDVTSPYRVVANPVTQDLEYYGVSSRKS